MTTSTYGEQPEGEDKRYDYRILLEEVYRKYGSIGFALNVTDLHKFHELIHALDKGSGIRFLMKNMRIVATVVTVGGPKDREEVKISAHSRSVTFIPDNVYNKTYDSPHSYVEFYLEPELSISWMRRFISKYEKYIRKIADRIRRKKNDE